MSTVPPEQPITLEERQAECKPLVLVIDDNPQYKKLFDLLADRLGITAYIVDSCGAATAVLEKFSFDVILMDWLMPEVDGAMCTKKIRAMEMQTGRRTPIIGVTGYVKATLELCVEAGMDDFLAVPFTFQELHDKLCFWLQQKKE
jgi:CheY-like chemotaxis protein